MNKKILVVEKNIGAKRVLDEKGNLKAIEVNSGAINRIKSIEITVKGWWEFWK